VAGNDLLTYYRLDTLAMVRIREILRNLCRLSHPTFPGSSPGGPTTSQFHGVMSLRPGDLNPLVCVVAGGVGSHDADDRSGFTAFDGIP